MLAILLKPRLDSESQNGNRCHCDETQAITAVLCRPQLAQALIQNLFQPLIARWSASPQRFIFSHQPGYRDRVG